MKKIKIFSILFSLFLLVIILFQIKFKVQNLNSEMNELTQQLKYERDNIHILKAEWAYLIRPARLQKLNNKFLQMDLAKANQIKVSKKDCIIIAEENNPNFEMVNNSTKTGMIVPISLNQNKKPVIKKNKWRHRARPVIKKYK